LIELAEHLVAIRIDSCSMGNDRWKLCPHTLEIMPGLTRSTSNG
jgi:hypothetical protein